mmetsp:Transcript_129464/g.414959  ORF Transcript_129464/g.414959 Transcript_129464/m.414959 type:complete len:212 (-) Transcript_129464:331-966(-)
MSAKHAATVILVLGEPKWESKPVRSLVGERIPGTSPEDTSSARNELLLPERQPLSTSSICPAEYVEPLLPARDAATSRLAGLKPARNRVRSIGEAPLRSADGAAVRSTAAGAAAWASESACLASATSHSQPSVCDARCSSNSRKKRASAFKLESSWRRKSCSSRWARSMSMASNSASLVLALALRPSALARLSRSSSASQRRSATSTSSSK